MDVVLEHIREHQTYYTAGGVVFIALLPLIYLTRRWSVPLIQYTLETVIYVVCMHFGVGAVTRVAAWFKDQSSMKRAFDIRNIEAPGWTTPWLRFWEREAYEPAGLFWFEVAAALFIVFLVWRYRPLRIKRKPVAPTKRTHIGYDYNPNPKPARKGWGGRS